MEKKQLSENGHQQSDDFGLAGSIIAGGLGFLIGKASAPPIIKQVPPPPVVSYPGFGSYLDTVIATLTEGELISLSMSIIKCTYLRSLHALDTEWKIQPDMRTYNHLINGASKSLKTPFLTKVVVYKVANGFSSSLLLSEGSFTTKTMTMAAPLPFTEPGPSPLMKAGVSMVLANILSDNIGSTVIPFESSIRVGRHGRFRLSNKECFYEALAFNNAKVSTFDDLINALSLYYAALITSLSPASRNVILSPNFNFNGFCTLDYKSDGCGFLTNFKSLIQY